MDDAVNGDNMKNYKKPEILIDNKGMHKFLIPGFAIFNFMVLFTAQAPSWIFYLLIAIYTITFMFAHTTKLLKNYFLVVYLVSTFSLFSTHFSGAYLFIKSSLEFDVIYGYMAISLYLFYLFLIFYYDILTIKYNIKRQKSVSRMRILRYSKVNKDKEIYITEDDFRITSDKDFPEEIDISKFMSLKIFMILAVPFVILGLAGPALGMYSARHFPSIQEFMLGILAIPLFGWMLPPILSILIGYFQTDFNKIAQEIADKYGV